ncbi:MAG: carbohydrate binding domain-containing protein [Verrucomicrobiae bacterium]|nr:carbohydrate binding domain-containing protein [Verrucomicrobiae bacterium]
MKTMTALRRGFWLAALLAGLGIAGHGAEAEASLFPFVLPWDDATPGITDLSGSLVKPAGRNGHVTVSRDGHFQVGGQRIRFLGVNMCFAATVPQKPHAEVVARRLAKFGINVVRFHHMDTADYPRGIINAKGGGSGDIHPEALDRLQYFVAQLKTNGIYANLNLLVGRRFRAADGLPAEIEKLDWKDRHLIGFWDEKHLQLQKDYARALLTAVNPYTRLSFAEDPAVAFVEINNEQGLIHGWLGGEIDRMPAVFQESLRRQWNVWLKEKYVTTPRLRLAWGSGEAPLGAEMLANGGFTEGLQRWNREQHAPARMSGTLLREVPPGLAAGAQAVRLTVEQVGKESWHLQFNQSGLRFEKDQPYTLVFWARTDAPRVLSVSAGQAHEPWGNLGLSASASASANWTRFEFVFRASQSDTNGRISLSGFGGAGAVTDLAGFSLKPGGVIGLREGEQIETLSFAYFDRKSIGQRTPAAYRDWMQFLYETEDRYWQTMYRFLKHDLKVRGLVTGTIVGCSPATLQAKMDWVDTHAYWQHPQFPVRPWDAEEWIVPNRTMVNERGGTLPGLALKRAVGKPHACTEYNHPAPNTFNSEGFLLLAAYAALQDWDAIYPFAWSHSGSESWNSQRIGSFFDIDQHPTKLVTLVAAHAFFNRGDIAPARTWVVADLPPARDVELLMNARSWSLVDAAQVGLPREASLVHRVAFNPEGRRIAGALAPSQVKLLDNRYASDTGELLWDVSEKQRGVVTVNSPRSKAVIGYGGGRTYALRGVVIAPGETLQNGWCAITVTAAENAATPRRWLVTATGLAQNTGMVWKNAEKSSVGRQWGRAPSLVEGIPARLTFAQPASRTAAWALDARGQRAKELPVRADAQGQAVIEIGPQWQTLWYEVGSR